MAVESSPDPSRKPYELSSIPSNPSVAPGTNILVGGPSMSGKRRVGLRILAAGSAQGQGAIVITTTDDADRIIEEYAQVGGATDDAALGVVDCISSQRDDASRREDDRITYARSPRDMTGIGTNFSNLLDEFCTARGRQHNRVMLDSVSTLLMYFDVQTVFRFLHVFTRRIDTANAIGVVLIDSTAHETQTINTLLQLFDTTLTVEESTAGEPPTLQFQQVQ